MTPSTDETLHDALLLVARAADAVSGTPIGLSQQAANAAASFAASVGTSPASVETIYLATLLAATGSLAGAGDDRDAPLAAVAFVSGLPAAVRSATDAIRWQRECWDGSGDPDGLRWQAIPAGAAIVGIARRFAETMAADPSSGREGAAFDLLGSSGRRFDPALADRFGRYVVEHPAAEPRPALSLGDAADAAAVLDRLSEAIESRVAIEQRRAAWLAATIAAAAHALSWPPAEVARMRTAAMLTALLLLGESGDRRAADGPEIAGRILDGAGGFASHAPTLREAVVRESDRHAPGDPAARLLAAALATVPSSAAFRHDTPAAPIDVAALLKANER